MSREFAVPKIFGGLGGGMSKLVLGVDCALYEYSIKASVVEASTVVCALYANARLEDEDG